MKNEIVDQALSLLMRTLVVVAAFGLFFLVVDVIGTGNHDAEAEELTAIQIDKLGAEAVVDAAAERDKPNEFIRHPLVAWHAAVKKMRTAHP